MFNAVILMCAIVEFNVPSTKCTNVDLGLHRTKSQCETVLDLGKDKVMRIYIEEDKENFVLMKEGFCWKEDTPS
jgi:hypothetical protein